MSEWRVCMSVDLMARQGKEGPTETSCVFNDDVKVGVMNGFAEILYQFWHFVK